LRAFQRVDVKAGQTAKATLELTPRSFEFFDPETNTVHPKVGEFEVLYGNSSQDKDLKKLHVSNVPEKKEAPDVWKEKN
jgi:beta-glucosidase